MEKAKRQSCYIYKRVSTAMQIDGYSLEAQEESLVKEAKHRNMRIAGIYSDEGKSGKNISDRTEFRRMLNDIANASAKDRPDYVMVFKLSRFGRNAADTLSSLQFLEDYGVNLLCVEDGIDSAGAAGKLMISVYAAVAEVERENIRVQTMAGREQKARDGKWNGGFAPYGYRLEYKGNGTGELIIDEEEAAIIKLIFEKYNDSLFGVAGVAKWLNDNGYRKKLRQNGTVDRFSAAFVKGVIDNPVYMGKIAYGRRRNEKIDGTRNEFHVVKQDKDSYEIYDGNHEAIISEEDWYMAAAKRSKNAYKREKIYSKEHEHMLSAIVKCPVCGASMYGAVNRKKKKNSEEFYTDMFYYVCKNRKMVSGKPCSYKRHIRQDEMDAEAVAILRYVLYHVDFKSVFEAQMKDMTNLESLNEKLQRLTEIYEKQEMKKSKLLAKIKALDPSDITYDDMYDNLQGLLREIIVELSQLEQQIEQTKGDIATERHIMFTVEQYEELAKDAIENLGKYSPAKRKALAQLFLDSIQIFEDKNEQGAWIKSVRLKMPLMFGEDEAYELSGFSFTANKTENPSIHINDENSLPNENHDESVILMQYCGKEKK